MNLNDGEEEDSFFNQHCLELAKLLRTEQTEHFLHLYDSLPSEWNGLRLEAAKEYIRQLQELDENEFQLIYQREFHNEEKEQNLSTIVMSNLPKKSVISRNDDNDGEKTITANSRITSLAIIQKKQHIERTTANNLACDEQHDISSKHSSLLKRNNDELNTQTRRLQPITNNNTHDMISNNCRTRIPVDSFVQLNLKPSIDITVEDYKKTRVSLPTTKNSSTNNRSSVSQSIDSNASNQSSIIPNNIIKNRTISMENKSHEEASFDYFLKNDEDDRQHSRSSSSSPTTIPFSTSSSSNNHNDLTINQTLSREHSKLISNNDFDSHGSSIETKSSSENSGSARTGSGSDSDDEHHHHHHQSGKTNSLTITKPSLLAKNKLFNNDDTPTVVLNQTSDNRPNQHDRFSSLPKQDSYELVQLNINDEHHVRANQLPRFKISATDDPNGINNSSNDILSYNTQRSQQNNLSSSHQNRNPEYHEQYNTNHSNSSRKSTARSSKKRKQSQQQEIIRTEFIPGHRGNLDVDDLVMFIDGNSSSKQQQQKQRQRQNSAPLRPTDTNKLKSTSSLPETNSNNNNTTTTTRRKSRKPIKILEESINGNENKTSQIDEDAQSIGFIDEDDETTTHSIDNTYHEQDTTSISLPNDDESHSTTVDIDSTNDSNTTNGETSLPEWLEPVRSLSPANDDNDSFSLSSTILNNSYSEITSEPFVTVTHRRRLTKERRQDTNSPLSRFSSSSNTKDKRRFQPPPPSTQNGAIRSRIHNTLSNVKPFVSTTTKEENTNTISPPSQPVSQPSVSSVLNNLPEQSSPRLSSHSSSSSLSSSLKRQSKPPPVVFLNKSVDVQLNDVSFGFDIENPSSDQPSTQTSSPPFIDKDTEMFPSSIQSNDLSTSNLKFSSSRRSYQQQRNNRGPLFYSGTDIHHHHRNYPSQTPVTQSPYIDPLFLLQYNQQRIAANYSQQLAYMNLLRTQYISSQSPYVLIPTTYTTTNDTEQDEKTHDDETIQTSEHIQEPLLVYTTIPTQLGPVYLPPIKKLSNDLEQQQQSTIYPSQYYYPTQVSHMIPSHTAYFQPISSPSLLMDRKSQQNGTDDEEEDDEEEEEDNDYEKSTRLFHQTRQQSSSSHIMSNALQLVYSQERRNAQTDRFNLDQLTAYLAMKWTDTIDHYEQGDDEILLLDKQ